MEIQGLEESLVESVAVALLVTMESRVRQEKDRKVKRGTSVNRVSTESVELTVRGTLNVHFVCFVFPIATTITIIICQRSKHLVPVPDRQVAGTQIPIPSAHFM